MEVLVIFCDVGASPPERVQVSFVQSAVSLDELKRKAVETFPSLGNEKLVLAVEDGSGKLVALASSVQVESLHYNSEIFVFRLGEWEKAVQSPQSLKPFEEEEASVESTSSYELCVSSESLEKIRRDSSTELSLSITKTSENVHLSSKALSQTTRWNVISVYHRQRFWIGPNRWLDKVEGPSWFSLDPVTKQQVPIEDILTLKPPAGCNWAEDGWKIKMEGTDADGFKYSQFSFSGTTSRSYRAPLYYCRQRVFYRSVVYEAVPIAAPIKSNSQLVLPHEMLEYLRTYNLLTAVLIEDANVILASLSKLKFNQASLAESIVKLFVDSKQGVRLVRALLPLESDGNTLAPTCLYEMVALQCEGLAAQLLDALLQDFKKSAPFEVDPMMLKGKDAPNSNREELARHVTSFTSKLLECKLPFEAGFLCACLAHAGAETAVASKRRLFDALCKYVLRYLCNAMRMSAQEPRIDARSRRGLTLVSKLIALLVGDAKVNDGWVDAMKIYLADARKNLRENFVNVVEEEFGKWVNISPVPLPTRFVNIERGHMIKLQVVLEAHFGPLAQNLPPECSHRLRTALNRCFPIPPWYSWVPERERHDMEQWLLPSCVACEKKVPAQNWGMALSRCSCGEPFLPNVVLALLDPVPVSPLPDVVRPSLAFKSTPELKNKAGSRLGDSNSKIKVLDADVPPKLDFPVKTEKLKRESSGGIFRAVVEKLSPRPKSPREPGVESSNDGSSAVLSRRSEAKSPRDGSNNIPSNDNSNIIGAQNNKSNGNNLLAVAGPNKDQVSPRTPRAEIFQYETPGQSPISAMRNVCRLEFADQLQSVYLRFFYLQNHVNFVVRDETGVLAVVSVLMEDGLDGGSSSLRCLMLDKDNGYVRFVIRHPTSNTSKWTTADALKCIKSSFKHASVTEANKPKLCDVLAESERKLLVRTYKFGVLCQRQGQTHEREMYGNKTEDCSKNYLDFLNLLGNRIQLSGHLGFRGGLECKGHNSTGEHSHYRLVKFNSEGKISNDADEDVEEVEIMWHVSTLLPFVEGDEQQIQRKRHLGNDVVIVVFSESDKLFDPSTFASQFNHVWIVVSKVTGGFTASIITKLGVQPFRPFLPEWPVFSAEELGDWLVMKCLNAERVSLMKSPFCDNLINTRAKMMKLWDSEQLFEREEGAALVRDIPVEVPSPELHQDEKEALIALGQQLLVRLVNKRPVDVTGVFNSIREITYRLLDAPLEPLSPTSQRPPRSPSPPHRDVPRLSSTSEMYRQDFLAALCVICWAVFDMACKQGDEFNRGSITIIDPGHSVVKFFNKYVKVAAKVGRLSELSRSDTGNVFAYRRDPRAVIRGEEEFKGLHIPRSSHHKGHCTKSSFGIDVRLFGEKDGLTGLLPNQMKHILYGQLWLERSLEAACKHEELFFLKFETCGLGTPEERRIHIFNYLAKKEHSNSRKEDVKHIPAVILEGFKKFQEAVNLEEGDFHNIRLMVLAAKSAQESSSQKIQDAGSSFLALVDEVYPTKSNHVRCANEVIVDLSCLVDLRDFE